MRTQIRRIVDSARALIVELRNVRLAQPGVWLRIGIATGALLIGIIAVPADCGTRESRWPKIPKFPLK